MSLQESHTKDIYCPRKLICVNPSADGMALQLKYKLLFTYMAFALALFQFPCFHHCCSVQTEKAPCLCFVIDVPTL